jgi:hypothetical protein
MLAAQHLLGKVERGNRVQHGLLRVPEDLRD